MSFSLSCQRWPTDERRTSNENRQLNAGYPVDDEQLERRMRDWARADAAAREAERAMSDPTASAPAEGVESIDRRAARLRRFADAMHASILEDVRLRSTAQQRAMPQSQAQAS